MQLDDYIYSVLTNICNGVRKAKIEQMTITQNCPISPGRMEGKDIYEVEKVHFDIGITTESQSQKEGGVSINVLQMVKTDGSLSKDYKEQIVNRIQFDIPFYPAALTNSNNIDRQ